MPYQNFLATLSSPRSGVYKRVFRTQNELETSGAILWGQSVGMSLMSLVLTFEVALRNRVHVSLSRQASSKLQHNPVDSFPWYDSQKGWIQLSGESHAKVEKLLCANGVRLQTQPPPDQVISKLSFGFWSNTLDSQLSPAIEALTFAEVFPNHPKAKKHWKYLGNRKDAVAVIKDVQVWRNRIAHCKPVWNEGWFRSSPTQHWTELLSRLQAKHHGVLTYLEWMCPSTAALYRSSFPGRLFTNLLSESAIWAHLQAPTQIGHAPIFTAPPPDELAKYKART